MLNNIIKKVLNESTNTKGSRGSFNPPLRPGLRKWFKSTMNPFNQELSEYVNAENHYDSLDGKMSKNNKKTSSKESKSKKIRNKDWNVEKKKNKINEWIEITPETEFKEIIGESNSAVTAGLYNGPMELGMKKWKKQLAPFNIELKHNHNEKAKKTKLDNNVNRVVGMWEKGSDGSYNIPTYDADGVKQKSINEDLAVWFGTKKKPKGSKQPKGPWVNICRKKEGGGHPPCGRPEASDKGYPKCRAAGVASKMTDAQKRSACSQKRRAEKTHSKSGTGNKPKMVSYKPKKKRMSEEIERLVKLIF
jgi:hypothetical protein